MIGLEDIIEHKKHKMEKAQETLSLDEIERTAAPVKNRGFKAAISRGGRINLIAELKKASPSHGVIRHDYDPAAIARIYKKSGAAALSVLTEVKYFQGNMDHLKAVRQAVDLPILRKDFIISEYQVYETAIAGADAVLLIAAALDRGMLKALFHESKSLGMDVIIEVHDQRDLDKALGVNADIIGINNRDLRTLETDLNITRELIAKVAPGKIIISESGLREPEDVQSLALIGVKAVLIGAVFMEADDIGAEVKRVMAW
ncbi:MAG: indole-3-glycerol phosphate synthase TrpC [Candidatus Omnitrophica bacterium]|nr:indole-3-glycerol phosphate synthase TrpC [Candidatus Omnitrophota bacterium]